MRRFLKRAYLTLMAIGRGFFYLFIVWIKIKRTVLFCGRTYAGKLGNLNVSNSAVITICSDHHDGKGVKRVSTGSATTVEVEVFERKRINDGHNNP